jgi:Raf kinase inhibitor-like YbhB/YbcL family protein
MKHPWLPISALAAVVVIAAGCNSKSNPPASGGTTGTPTVTLRAPDSGGFPLLTVTSTAFANGGLIPSGDAQLGCGGSNVNPDISWSGAPPTTVVFVVTMFDPDAPTGAGFWHWLQYNIPPAVTTIGPGAWTDPTKGVQGLNDYGALGYGGPCPPVGDGVHHYRFVVSALNVALSGMPTNTTGAFLTFNMRGHIVAQGSYTGLFSR